MTYKEQINNYKNVCVHIIFMQADDNKYQVVLSLYLDIVNITYIDIHMNYVHSDSIKYTG